MCVCVCVCVSLNWVTIASDNGFSPLWRQSIIWTSAGLLPIWSLGSNLIEIRIEIQMF